MRCSLLLTLALALRIASCDALPSYRAVLLSDPRRPTAFGVVECARGGWFGGWRAWDRNNTTKRRATVWRLDGTVLDLHPAEMYLSWILGTDGSTFVGLVWPESPQLDLAAIWTSPTFNVHYIRPPNGLSDSGAYAVEGSSVGGYVGRNTLLKPALWNGSEDDFLDMANPLLFFRGEVFAMEKDYQVGYVSAIKRSYSPAIIWRGSPNDFTLLTLPGEGLSRAFGCRGDQQVGRINVPNKRDKACLWHGKPDTLRILHPSEFLRSEAHDTNGTTQVGFATTRTSPPSIRAIAWFGSSGKYVNLHDALPFGFDSGATCIDDEGNIGGWYIPRANWQPMPVIWVPEAPAPRSNG